MADTGRSEPLVNGNVDAMDDEEKAKIRPADIDADVREMERRKRVEMVMNSRLFREELERIIDTQMKDGNGPSGLLQQLSEMMGVGHGRPMQARSGSCVAPINDIRGVESMGYAKGEKILRCKLAAVFRLMDLYGWTHGIGSQITARLNQEQELFLVNPFGVLFNEVTASSLVKLDMQAAVAEQGTTNFGVNAGAFLVHSALYAARPDVKCVVHVVTPSVLSVSALKAGLLPLCHEAAVLGEASVHHYSGGALGPEGRDKMARDLGPVNKVLLLSNHGALCCGETVEEAFFHVYNLALACDTQMKLLPLGVDNLVLMGDEARKAAFDAARRAPDAATPAADAAPTTPRKEKQWRVGATHFEALMRMLDNAGFRTGYVYRSPLIRAEPPRPRNDIELPPAVASLGYLFDEDDKNGPWRKYVDGRKTHDRTRWLNSPNVYQKVEILETGTPDPRKITKWVADGSPTHSSTPVKIDSALQFVPKNTHPREFKKLQQQIKDNRRADKITSGPQSHILEGVSWEEAKKLQDAGVTQAGEQVILVGAASKGIIQRGFQHNATVYKTPYAKNPFDAVTDDDLEEYKRSVQRHTKGESFEEEQSESEALSSSLRRGLASPNTASETEEESRDEPRVLRIETKLVPRASQAEVVLSDAADFPDSGFERSKSLRHSGQAASGGRSAGDFFRSFSLGPAQRKKGARNERSKPSRVEPTKTTSREPLHFHVARLSAAPRVLHASRLPLSGHGLTLRNLVDRSTKMECGLVAKPSNSCVGGIGVKSVIGCVNSVGSVSSEFSEPASPDNPFNNLSQLNDSFVEPAYSQSNLVSGHTTDVIQTVQSPSNEVVNNVIPNEVHVDYSYSTHSLQSHPEKSGLSHSQRVKLLKLRFLEMYPPAMKSATPPPVPPKPTRPWSCESEGYCSMTSLASLNPLDQTELNRRFEAQLRQLEFSPLLRDVKVPVSWDSACVEECRQRLDKELTHIEYLLEKFECEEFELREQLLDLLPQDEEVGEETMVEESVNYLDKEISILQFEGLVETEDNQAVESSRTNQLVPEEKNIHVGGLVDADGNISSAKMPENTLLNNIDREMEVEKAAKTGIVLMDSHEELVPATDHSKGDGNFSDGSSECNINVHPYPLDYKCGIVGGIHSTVEFIDASFVVGDQQEEDILKVQNDDIETEDENVCNVCQKDDATDDEEKEVGKFVDILVADQKIDTLQEGFDSNGLDGRHEEFNVEVNIISDSDSFEMDIIVDAENDFPVGNGVDTDNILATNISVSNEEVIDAHNNDKEAKDVVVNTSTLEIVQIADQNLSIENMNNTVDDDNFPFCIDPKVVEDAKVGHLHGASFQLDGIDIPYLESPSSKSGSESPVFNGSMRNWPSLEKGMSSIPELGYSFNIDECFPDPVRPLQYDDEEYIRKPYRPKVAYRIPDVAHEEVIGDEKSHQFEEGTGNTTESKEHLVDELHGMMDDGSEDEYFVDGVSYEQFEKEMSSFFSAMNDVKKCQSEYKDSVRKDNKGNKDKMEPMVEGELDVCGLNNSVVSVVVEFNDSNNEEFAFVAKDIKNDQFLAVAVECLEQDLLCDDNLVAYPDRLAPEDVESVEMYQHEIGNKNTKLAEAELPETHHLTISMKEGLAADRGAANIVQEVLAEILDSINTGSDGSEVDMQAVNLEEEKPKPCMEVNDFEVKRNDEDEDKTNWEVEVHKEEEMPLEDDFEEDDISDHLFDADRSSSENEPDVSEADNHSDELNASAEFANGSPGSARRLSLESGAGDASALFDPFDLELRRLNNSFIPIEVGSCDMQRSLQPLARSCCFHYLSTSSDTGSTNEETDVTSPSDAEYEADMPATLGAELSPRCQEVLDTPLHYSFHIRDENGESLELPTSPLANTEGAAVVPAVSQRGAFASTLQKAIQEIEMMGEPVTNDEVGAGFHVQEETPKDIKPVISWHDSSADFVKIKEEPLSFVEQKPEPKYSEEANVNVGDFGPGPLIESNIPGATSEVYASSWNQPGRLWSMISYTEYEPIGNSTTTSQLDVEVLPSSASTPTTAGDLTEANEASTNTSPFISCGSDSHSALSSQCVLSSPDLYFDSQAGDQQDQPSQ